MVLVFPVPFWLTGVICSIMGTYWQGMKKAHSNVMEQITVSFWTCSITINLYATCELCSIFIIVIVTDLVPQA